MTSLARRFAHMAALLAGIAMLVIAIASWWEHAASLRDLQKKDAEMQATIVSNNLGEIAERMSELANSRLIASALIDSAGKENYLAPFLRGIRRINGIPVQLLFVDFEGREIASNGQGSFSEPELNWLREKLPAGLAAARVQLGEKGEELLAVEFIAFARSNSVEGAVLYKIKLDELSLQGGARIVHGPEAKQLLHSQAIRVAAVKVPPIYQQLDFAVLTRPNPSAKSVDWQWLGVNFILLVGMVVTVIMLGLHFGKRLTRDLLSLGLFAQGVAEKGLVTGHAEAADSLEVASLTQSINSMLDRLGKAGEALRQSNDDLEEKNKQSQTLSEELQSQQEELKQSNEELEEKNHLLAEQKLQVEHQNREIETSRLALQERAEQLALTSKYKSEFLSNMSHELRTPLNSLLILAQILAENPEHNLSEQQIEYAKIIQGSGKDLLELINDILDLSKIESGTVTLDLQDVSLASVSAQIERTFRHVAESRSLGFSVELAPDLPESLHTDAQRLQQVLKNLLSNAFKFTQQGQVSVRIAAVESGWSVDHDGLNRAGAVIGFFVTDSGIGLAADKQKIIFEAFQQADTGTARKYGGTGLGLSISRELARLFGGELHLVESSPGQGSTFALFIPLRARESGQDRTSLFATETQRHKENPESKKPLDSLLGSRTSRPHAGRAQRGERSSPALPVVADDRTLLSINPAANLAGKKVLVVDDDMRNIFALTAVLERHKMVVLSAENGRDALEALGNNPDVDIVLMDIMMPGMDGYEAMRQIRQMKQFETLPMIALTAKAMQGDREQCIAAGASDYISKPVDTDQLLSLLRVWLYR